MHFLNQSGRHAEERHMIFQYGFFSRVCCCSGLVLLFTAYVAPSWIETPGPVPSSMGLWSICTEKSCRGIVNVSDILRATRILMSVSVACGLVAVSLAFLTNTTGNDPKWPMISNLVTGLLTLATMLLFGLSSHSKSIHNESVHTHHQSFHFNWAYMVGCLAASSFLISALLYVLITLQEIIKIRSKTHLHLEKTERPSPPV